MSSGFARLLTDMHAARLRFVVVGGIAVIRHGVVRATRDLDVVVPSDDETTMAIRELAGHWNATFQSGEAIDSERIAAGRLVPLSTAHGEVDFLPELRPPLDFDGLAARADTRRIDGVEAAICSLADLVALKRIAARPRDEVDLRDLEEANGELPPSPE